MVTLHFATTNKNKTIELQRIASNIITHKIIVKPLEAGIVESEENGKTFTENSEIKFLYYEQYCGIQDDSNFVIAEDSGFEISDLDNFPSVHSARFLKQFTTHEEAFLEIKEMLLQKFGKPLDNIKAKFVCDLCTRINNKLVHFSSSVNGSISLQFLNDKGFGYDPIFIPENHTKTFAQMSGTEKDGISHRGQAFQQFLSVIL